MLYALTSHYLLTSFELYSENIQISRVGSKPMETPGICEIDLPNRRIVSGSESPTDLDSPCQEEVAGFNLGLCGPEEERGETPGREDSPSDLGEAELDPGGDPKAGDDKAFGKEVVLLMQALNSLATPEEKLAALCKKYADLVGMLASVFLHRVT
ncbi:beta-taxilin-like isoform X1 [Poecilia formosa]|uniref:beta-taxilin-like isoform X1 n=2 Tax=Poecilia formosa TaxID=48698 RepID=UPI0007B92C38|nr:PREDICTED: beta-taxilin-like isoform X1 [Poecilia formosa]